MAKKKQRPPRTENNSGHLRRLSLPLLLAIVQVIALPGMASVYRLPKASVAIAGLAVIVGLSLTAALWRGQLTFPRSPLLAVLLTLPTWQLTSAWWSANPLRAVTTGLSALVWILAAGWLSQRPAEERARAVRWTAIGAATSAIVVLFQLAGMPIFSFLATGRRNLTGLAGNPSDLAIGSALLLPLLMAGVSLSKKNKGKFVVPGILAAAVVASQSFTGILALCAFTLAWAWTKGSTQVRIVSVVLLIMVAAGVIAVDPAGRIERLQSQIERGRWYIMMSAREDGWSAASVMIRQHPALGVGAGNFDHLYYPNRLKWLEEKDLVGGRGELATHFSWAHCDPLQLGAEIGAVGWAWMIALLVLLYRQRADDEPLTLLFMVTFTPFALLHYPTHLAVGAVPLLLFLSARLAHAKSHSFTIRVPIMRLAAAALVLMMAGGTVLWQAKRMALDAWRGNVEAALASPTTINPAQIEASAAMTIQANRGAAGWILRLVGKARLLGGDANGAITAFDAAWQLWPHEEAEFGLGVALAEAGRRQEGLIHLDRVCRTNPALAKMIGDLDLRRSVRVVSRRRAQRSK